MENTGKVKRCSVRGCTNLYLAKGLCNKHYIRKFKGKRWRRNYYLSNREHTLKVNQQWHENNKEKHKRMAWKSHLKIKYRLTPEEYEAMQKAQGGKCYICQQKQEKKLAVDHCHKTNEVRGLLCHHCNSGLGYFRDSIQALKKAAIYLQKFLTKKRQSTILNRRGRGNG